MECRLDTSLSIEVPQRTNRLRGFPLPSMVREALNLQTELGRSRQSSVVDLPLRWLKARIRRRSPDYRLPTTDDC